MNAEHSSSGNDRGSGRSSGRISDRSGRGRAAAVSENGAAPPGVYGNEAEAWLARREPVLERGGDDSGDSAAVRVELTNHSRWPISACQARCSEHHSPVAVTFLSDTIPCAGKASVAPTTTYRWYKGTDFDGIVVRVPYQHYSDLMFPVPTLASGTVTVDQHTGTLSLVRARPSKPVYKEREFFLLELLRVDIGAARRCRVDGNGGVHVQHPLYRNLRTAVRTEACSRLHLPQGVTVTRIRRAAHLSASIYHSRPRVADGWTIAPGGYVDVDTAAHVHRMCRWAVATHRSDVHAAFLVFRGTDVSQGWQDILSDALFLRTTAHASASVNDGLRVALCVWNMLKDNFNDIAAAVRACGRRHVIACGHSLGGALAQVAALFLHHPPRGFSPVVVGAAGKPRRVHATALTFAAPMVHSMSPGSRMSAPTRAWLDACVNVVRVGDPVPLAPRGLVAEGGLRSVVHREAAEMAVASSVPWFARAFARGPITNGVGKVLQAAHASALHTQFFRPVPLLLLLHPLGAELVPGGVLSNMEAWGVEDWEHVSHKLLPHHAMAAYLDHVNADACVSLTGPDQQSSRRFPHVRVSAGAGAGAGTGTHASAGMDGRRPARCRRRSPEPNRTTRSKRVRRAIRSTSS